MILSSMFKHCNECLNKCSQNKGKTILHVHLRTYYFIICINIICNMQFVMYL